VKKIDYEPAKPSLIPLAKQGRTIVKGKCSRCGSTFYGQSFGGAAVVKFARELKVLDIPVILTVQVDSVGRNDEVIPSNVAAAANLFQRDGFFVRGCRTIRAENPRTTEIIGNFQFTYRDSAIHLSGVPWYKKAFRRAHARMDLDPAVWNKVAELILSALRPGSRRSETTKDDALLGGLRNTVLQTASGARLPHYGLRAVCARVR
jgi:hypothetical protein